MKTSEFKELIAAIDEDHYPYICVRGFPRDEDAEFEIADVSPVNFTPTVMTILVEEEPK